MKPSKIHSVFVVLMVFLISSCTSLAAQPASGEISIVCEVFYRSTSGGNLEAVPKINFPNENNQVRHEFGTLVFEARYQDDAYEGRALSIAVTGMESGSELARQLFQFDPQNPPKNQFIGGHGFTGLNYIYDPGSSAEMQYFCSVE